MIKLSTKNRRMTSLLTSVVVLITGLNATMAAEFVVQTDLDSGSGSTIAEISPDVFTIDTLRSAVEQANDEVNFPGPDTITFDENIVTVNPGGIYTIIILSQVGDQFNFQTQSSNSALPIDSIITIQGTLPDAAEALIILEADGLRHFQVNNGGKLRLYNLILQNGETPLNSSGRGGAVVVLDNGKLETNVCSFNSNQAVNGGALAFQQGALDGLIQNSKFLFNAASDENSGTSNLGLGGAIYADLGTNSIIIENTYYSFNDADANGGAVYINRPFEILNSTFERNTSNINGGVLYIDEQAQYTISNSLFFDNESDLLGGAVYNGVNTIDAGQIFNSTFAKNIAGWGSASRQSRGLLKAGGAIYSPIVDNLIIHNSIVADNFDAGANDDIAAALSPASSFNLIGVAGEVMGVTHNTNGNLIGTAQQPIDPGLKQNQLFTSVIGLESSSPAVNSGSDAQVITAGLSTDIEGNDRVIGTAVDRGAFETDVFFYNGFE